VPTPYADITPMGVGFKTDTRGTVQHVDQYRITEPVRIENPDNSDEFIMVDRVKRIAFAAKDSLAGGGVVVETSSLDPVTGDTKTTTSSTSGTAKFNKGTPLSRGVEVKFPAKNVYDLLPEPGAGTPLGTGSDTPI
jgi:hypothetical protein